MTRFITVVVIALGVMLVGCNDKDRGPLTKQAVEEMLKEHTPLGTDRVDVMALLDSKKIEHSGHAKKDSQVIYAILREASASSSGVRRAIQIQFEFDLANKLVKYAVEEQFTGP
jgi:hypothetical protein